MEYGKIKITEGYDAYWSGVPTECLFTDNEGHYTISELIELLKMAKARWGDVPVYVSDVGFESSHVGDTVPVSQLYLYISKSGENRFCVIESTP
jgi:hypothetical protein